MGKTKMYLKTVLLSSLVLLLLVSTTISQDYSIHSVSLNCGGGTVISGDFALRCSMGQPTPVGMSESGDYRLYAGFQATTITDFEIQAINRGDVNLDGDIDIIDAMIVIRHILTEPPPPGEIFERADCNNDGSINILDVVGIVNVILGIGECAPGACKTNVTEETLKFLKALESYFPADEFERLMAAVRTEIQVPTEYSLAQNYPNPFNPITTIKYTLPKAAKVRVEVYNLLGQMVEILVDSEQEASYQSVRWDGSKMASGVYFYRLTTTDFTSTKRMVLMK